MGPNLRYYSGNYMMGLRDKCRAQVVSDVKAPLSNSPRHIQAHSHLPLLVCISKCQFSIRARVITRCYCHRTGQSEPAWRCVHQRTPSAEPHSPQDRGDGCSRSPTLRHLATTASVTRLCVQDTKPLPGDWQHSARGYRG